MHCSMRLMCVFSVVFDLILFADTSAQMRKKSGGLTRQTVVGGGAGVQTADGGCGSGGGV